MSRVQEHAALTNRHLALVAAVHDAIRTLEGPFSEFDYVPENISEAIEILRDALKA